MSNPIAIEGEPKTGQLPEKVRFFRFSGKEPYLVGLASWDDAQASLSVLQQKTAPNEDDRRSVEILERVFQNPEIAPELWGEQTATVQEDIADIEQTPIRIGIGSTYSYHEE